MSIKIGVYVNRSLRILTAVEKKADESTWVWDGKSERMPNSIVRLLFALFAENIIADLLVIFRDVRKIEQRVY
jgi:hypothetical protein